MCVCVKQRCLYIRKETKEKDGDTSEDTGAQREGKERIDNGMKGHAVT